MSNDFKDGSKKNWIGHTKKLTENEIKVGCLQRIADSLEKMELPYLRLLDDVAHLKEKHRERNAAIDHLNRRIASLQGVITRMKK